MYTYVVSRCIAPMYRYTDVYIYPHMVTQSKIDTSLYTYVSRCITIHRYNAIQRYTCITTPQPFWRTTGRRCLPYMSTRFDTLNDGSCVLNWSTSTDATHARLRPPRGQTMRAAATPSLPHPTRARACGWVSTNPPEVHLRHAKTWVAASRSGGRVRDATRTRLSRRLGPGPVH